MCGSRWRGVGRALVAGCALIPVAAWSSVRAQALEPATFTLSPSLVRDQVVRAKMGWSSVRGSVEAFRGDTLQLRVGPLGIAHRDIPLTAASRLDLRTGRASRARGALIGAGAGVLTGLMLGMMISDAFHGTVSDGAAISPYFMPYTIAGGAVFGALVPGDRWTRVRITPRP